jgi:protein TonB
VIRDRASRRAGVAGTAMAHGVVLVAALMAARQADSSQLMVYAIDMIAAPAPEETAPRRAAPEAEPVKQEHTVAVSKPKPKPPPKKPETPKKQPETSRVAENPPATRSAVKPLPGETPSTGQDAVTLRQQGKQFPYPEYLNNVVTQIYQRWDRPVGAQSLKATVWFVIRRDGSIQGLEIAESSGNTAFDAQALGAIERAGNVKAFGPLPSGWLEDGLAIAFSFTPKDKP